jgi:hypothetical protein
MVVYTVGTIERLAESPGRNPSPFDKWSAEDVEELKTTARGRLEGMDSGVLLGLLDMSDVLFSWVKWGGLDAARAKMAPLFASDDQLPKIIERYISVSVVSAWGDRVGRKVVKLDPTHFEDLTDIVALETRIASMLQRKDITADQRSAGQSYLKNMDRIRKGQKPGDFLHDD